VTTLDITARGYAGERDLPAIVALINRCEVLDQLDEGTSAAELRLEFSLPQFDPARDLRLWEDADRQLVGYGQLWFHDEAADPDGFVWYKVDPAARGGDLDAGSLGLPGGMRDLARDGFGRIWALSASSIALVAPAPRAIAPSGPGKR